MLDELLSLMPDAAVVVDDRGTITHVNQALLELFGYDAGELHGRPIEVLVPERLRTAHQGHRTAFTNAPRTRSMGAGLSLFGLRRDGSELPVDISLAPVDVDGRVAVVAAIRDVTERREAEHELRRLLAERDRARAERDELLISDERGRIARDLHDVVIQRLFATGLTIQATMPLVRDERAAERLAGVVEELDHTIREIRTTIFSLGAQERGEAGIRADVMRIVDESRRALGFTAATSFSGPIETALGPREAPHVLAVVREALANVARHARASHATVELTADVSRVEVVVTDDGVGVDPAAPRSGLQNLSGRAEELGGTLTVQADPAGGTVLRWSVPIAPTDADRAADVV